MRLKLSGPDFKDQDPVAALRDFRDRVTMYEKSYESIGMWEEKHGYSFCQMIDVGRKFVMHQINGHYAMQTVQYLQHFNLFPRQIWLTRHGESVDDVAGRIGGDSDLTTSGTRYAAALSRFIQMRATQWADQQALRDHSNQVPAHDSLRRTDSEDNQKQNFQVWTSRMSKSIQTAQFFDQTQFVKRHLPMLNELNVGILEGFTREEVKDFYSDWYNQRRTNKFSFRYPGTTGEGYLDVTNRLKSVILEVESVTDHVLLISGLAVTRILLAYFRGLHRDQIVDLQVPLGELHMLEPVSNHIPASQRHTEVLLTETIRCRLSSVQI